MAKYIVEIPDEVEISKDSQLVPLDMCKLSWWEEAYNKGKSDAVVIHCKDCRWWDREEEDSRMGYCHACKHGHYSRHWEISIRRTYEEDFFCADAEPKEEGEENDE